MAEPIAVDKWLGLIRSEYLGGFVRNGGAAVRFVVTPSHSAKLRFSERLRSEAEAEEYLCVTVDSAATRVHMIDKVFNAVAAQVDWRRLARGFLSRVLTEAHYVVPQEAQPFGLRPLAEMNGCQEQVMRVIVNKRLQDSVALDYRMTQEYRFAMTWLCLEQLDPGEVPAGLTDRICEWLVGTLRLVSTLKKSLIFQKVGRHNGRDMLFSLARWLHKCGKSGLVLVMDIGAVVVPPRSRSEERIRYSASAVLDTYEALRQFVDSTGELGHTMVFILVPPEFVDESERRSVYAYNALRYRALTEVRDRKIQNPLASLVVLDGDGDLALTMGTGEGTNGR